MLKTLRIPDIELANISRYRGELMGVAMLFVILFHVALPRSDVFYGLRRMGNIGVDIFFFLSGVGLWFSWTKHPDFWHFVRRRYLRIYPIWLIAALCYYVPRFHGGDLWAWIDLAGDVLINWDFWLHDELTFWYIPAIMMLYLLAPPYMELIRRHPVYRWLPVVMVMWCVAVQWVTPLHQAVGHIEIFWSRMPIFFIGINMGQPVLEDRRIDGQGLWLILLTFALGLSTSLYLEQIKHGLFPLFVERMLYIPLTVTTILLLNRILRRTPRWFNATFRWLGVISLECYLVHLHFVLDYLPRSLGYWGLFLLCIAITLPVAWLLSKVVEHIAQTLNKIIPQ